jgi:hypothetical protein
MLQQSGCQVERLLEDGTGCIIKKQINKAYDGGEMPMNPVYEIRF